MEPIKTGRVTLEQIAARCGVSKASVSYVLSGKQGKCAISENTARRILETAAALDYKKNEAAAALSAMKTAPLNLIVLSPWLYAQYSSFTVQVNGVLEAASDVRATYINYRIGGLREVLKPALVKKAHVLLLMGTSPQDEGWLLRNREKFPNLILLNRRLDGIPSSAGNDEEAIADLGARIASRNRYRRFLLLHSQHPSSLEKIRIDAFRRFFPASECFAVPENPGDTFTRLVSREEEGVFVFLPRFQPASLVLLRALKEGYTVPGRLGIASYDSHPLIEEYMPCRLTSIDQQTEKMTIAALEMARVIRGGGRPADACTKAVLIPGDTV